MLAPKKARLLRRPGPQSQGGADEGQNEADENPNHRCPQPMHFDKSRTEGMQAAGL